MKTKTTRKCGDNFFFHPKFHYINIDLLLLFLLPIAGSKAVCIANSETVTKSNLTILHTLVQVNKLRVAAPGAFVTLASMCSRMSQLYYSCCYSTSVNINYIALYGSLPFGPYVHSKRSVSWLAQSVIRLANSPTVGVCHCQSPQFGCRTCKRLVITRC